MFPGRVSNVYVCVSCLPWVTPCWVVCEFSCISAFFAPTQQHHDYIIVLLNQINVALVSISDFFQKH